ncbi:Endonuclease/exonuclease/phosphatase [Trema orientale]|uniref:Endonuclease/exonuclease/phosphatase n=1 Tax=Trema orientale TaxID=63057 RepID=A0A2P5FH54_TREOI|nr:Endonuclease/exonuclease/phosphatase [Trema orientale]
MVTNFKPDVLVLSELMISESMVKGRLQQLHFYNVYMVPAEGCSGGFCVAWKDGVDIEPHYCSKNLISCVVYSDPPGMPWSFSAVYGPPHASAQRSFWQSIPRVLERAPDAKLLIGDFNGVLLDCESWSNANAHGGFASSSGAMRHCFATMGLYDLGFSDPQFTWNRRRGGVLFSRARLDRAVATVEWGNCFPRALVKNIADSVSDHCPIVLDTNGGSEEGFKPFRYEAMWVRDIRSHWIVRVAWKLASHFPHARPIFPMRGS